MLIEGYENIRGFFDGCLINYATGLGAAILINKGLKAWIQSMKRNEVYRPPPITRQMEHTYNDSPELVILLANIMEGNQNGKCNRQNNDTAPGEKVDIVYQAIDIAAGL